MRLAKSLCLQRSWEDDAWMEEYRRPTLEEYKTQPVAEQSDDKVSATPIVSLPPSPRSAADPHLTAELRRPIGEARRLCQADARSGGWAWDEVEPIETPMRVIESRGYGGISGQKFHQNLSVSELNGRAQRANVKPVPVPLTTSMPL